VNRLEGETGFCGATSKLKVASFSSHFGEERPLVGIGGSGTIFLSHCNLGCVFCQNWDISHKGSGTDVEIENLASMMLQLQEEGCQNINVVTPTNFSPHVLMGQETKHILSEKETHFDVLAMEVIEHIGEKYVVWLN
jgi:putative pyruvate formate lyase activating enzyme